jgi:hypothetical protein
LGHSFRLGPALDKDEALLVPGELCDTERRRLDVLAEVDVEFSLSLRPRRVTEERLLTVGRRVRDLYPAKNADRVEARVDDTFMIALVSQVTAGFGGKVAIAPRLFLRELIDVMDRVDLHEDYNPADHYKLELQDGKLNPEELAAKLGRPLEIETESAGETEVEGAAKPPRRLDG